MSSSRLRVPVSNNDHRRGPEDAPLSLVEYGDYQCPFCSQAEMIVKQLQKDFEGKLQCIFRNFPLTAVHPDALNAARAAETAALQAKFWEMHDVLFEYQDDLSPDSILVYARGIDLDVGKFVEDLDDPSVDERLESDFQSGARSGVNGTPTFFINGWRHDGDWSYDSLAGALQTELSKSHARRRIS